MSADNPEVDPREATIAIEIVRDIEQQIIDQVAAKVIKHYNPKIELSNTGDVIAKCDAIAGKVYQKLAEDMMNLIKIKAQKEAHNG